MWEVNLIYMELIGVDWLSPAQEFEYYDEDVIDSDANSILFGIR